MIKYQSLEKQCQKPNFCLSTAVSKVSKIFKKLGKNHSLKSKNGKLKNNLINNQMLY